MVDIGVYLQMKTTFWNVLPSIWSALKNGIFSKNIGTTFLKILPKMTNKLG